MPMSDAERKQNEYIEAARALFQPVRLNHVPDFLRLRLLKAYGCDHGDTGGFSVLRHAMHRLSGSWCSWMDHWGSTVYHDRPAFAAEPPEATT